MARLARIVAPGLPHHLTARGNRREPFFFEDGDPDLYRDILAEQMRRANVEVWAYCLMPNHVHLIQCPRTAQGMASAICAAHRRWANFINARGRWRGHLFDGRFSSVAMDEAHLMAAIRYVALNRVRARLAIRAEDWPWSSTRAHLAAQDDALVTVGPVLGRAPDFAALLRSDPDDPAFADLRAAETTGRARGTPDFVADLERRLGRPIARRAPGRKPSATANNQGNLLRNQRGMVLLSPYSRVYPRADLWSDPGWWRIKDTK
jgi:putative transposase